MPGLTEAAREISNKPTKFTNKSIGWHDITVSGTRELY